MSNLIYEIPSNAIWGILAITLIQLFILIIIVIDLKIYVKTFGKDSSQYTSEKKNNIDNSLSDSEENSLDDIFEFDDEKPEDFYYLIKSRNPNSLMQSIESSINKYLKACRSVVCDYDIINDIVERHCDSQEQKIKAIQPFPTYIGLMGTMLGIIFGVISLLSSKDIEVLTNMTDPGGFNGEGIKALLSGVGVAMITSAVGLVISMIATFKIKKTFSSVEEKKNLFYSWFQADLLPNVSNDLSGTLIDLQKNLTNFNIAFNSNIKGFDLAIKSNLSSLSDAVLTVSSTYNNQINLIKEVQKTDFSGIMIANLEIVKKLEESSKNINQFSQYLHDINEYVSKVDNLTTNLEAHLNRTKLIEETSAFIKAEWTQIDSRKSLISTSVNDVDSFLRDSFDKLGEFTEYSLNKLKDSVNENLEVYVKSVENQKQAFTTDIKEINTVISELKNLSNIHSSLETMSTSFYDQALKLNEVSDSISISNELVKGAIESNNANTHELLMEIKKQLTSISNNNTYSTSHDIEQIHVKQKGTTTNKFLTYSALFRDILLIITSILVIIYFFILI